MREEVKIIDLNAHIENIKSEIQSDGNMTKAFISFQNLGFGDITAIKFIATGYNSFGDIVKINNSDTFYLIIQDICIEKNSVASGLKAILPSNEIRKLELVEHQICYKDNSVTTYVGEKIYEAHLMMYENCINDEYEVLQALKKKFNDSVSCIPIQLGDGWICGCGRYNSSNSESCSLCQCNKNELLHYTQDDSRESLMLEYNNIIRDEKQKTEQEQKEKQKAKKKKIIKIAMISIVSIIIAVLLGRSVMLASRTTYESEQEMRKNLRGTYTYYNPSTGKATRQIVISGNKAVYKHDLLDMGMRETFDSNIEWNYKSGKIHTIEDLIVLNTGDLKDEDGYVYKKGGDVSSKSSYNSYESGYSALKISNVDISTNSSYTVCTGSIKNTGNKTYSFVEVKGAFKNSSGEVIDTDWTYAVGSEGLAPNESKTFRMSVAKNYDIRSCSVSITDYD